MSKTDIRQCLDAVNNENRRKVVAPCGPVGEEPKKASPNTESKDVHITLSACPPPPMQEGGYQYKRRRVDLTIREDRQHKAMMWLLAGSQREHTRLASSGKHVDGTNAVVLHILEKVADAMNF